MKRIIYIAIITILSLPAMAQQESRDVRKGNKQYNKEQYTEAEVSYRKGLEKNNQSFEAHFNLGDALFRQEKYPEAIAEFQRAASLLQPGKDGNYSTADKEKLAAVHHNIGNAYYQQQQFDKAVESFKKSLRENPKNDETRYNLIKAQEKLQQQQQEQQQDQQEQNQEQQQQQQQQQQQNQEQQEQEQQEPPQSDPKEQNEQMDKEQAEQILQALQQDEQETQEKAKRQQSSTKFRTDKDW